MSADDPIMVSEGYNVVAIEGINDNGDNHVVLQEDESCWIELIKNYLLLKQRI